MIFRHDQLIPLTAAIFRSAGCSDEEAQRVAERLVESNLVGHDSHGVIRIPSYVQWLRDEKVFADKSIKVVFENEAVAVVDGCFGLGQTIGEQATRLGIEKAKRLGVAVVALRNSGHLGRIGDWPEMAARAGMISLHFVNTSGAGMLVAPYGGIDRRLSANPLAAGVPTGRGEPLILDMSACTIAEGKIRVAFNSGKTLPDLCVIDCHGAPTNDPRIFYADPPGAILPIAGHKGYGLSVMIEMLAGALTGGSCTNPKNAWRVINGMLSIVIDPLVLSTSDAFHSEVQRFIDFVKSSRTVTPGGEILMPGEIEQRTRALRLREGIEVDEVTWRQIGETCRALGVSLEIIEQPVGS
jgi:uncharacterized oxidoreductase